MVMAGIAAIAAFFGAFLIVFSLFSKRERMSPVQARIRSLAGPDPEEETINLQLPFAERVVRPLAVGIGEKLSNLLPTAFVARVGKLLKLAGSPFSLPAFMSLMFLSGVGFAGLFLVLALSVALSTSLTLLGVLVFGLLGLYIPYFWLARRVGKRQKEILRSLPNALDLITISVEAGLGLDAAFAKVSEKLPGPFAEELAQMLRETAMGRSRQDALREVGVRTGVPAVITFVNAITHAETTGMSIGDVLRAQADQIRTKRRQEVEATAQRMPIWMSFPLIVCILPSLFIVILAPVAIEVYKAFIG